MLIKMAIKSGILLLILWLFSCAPENTISRSETEEDNKEIPNSKAAETIAIEITGEENEYTFSVTILSPDTGCQQYADWWEVIDLEENLLYRRILGHSHVNEQPFTRSGGTIPINKEKEVYIRAHMNNLGYGSNVLRGSVFSGFIKTKLQTDFAATLESKEPLPSNCAF